MRREGSPAFSGGRVGDLEHGCRLAGVSGNTPRKVVKQLFLFSFYIHVHIRALLERLACTSTVNMCPSLRSCLSLCALSPVIAWISPSLFMFVVQSFLC